MGPLDKSYFVGLPKMSTYSWMNKFCSKSKAFLLKDPKIWHTYDWLNSNWLCGL